jgi:hypothetical protein
MSRQYRAILILATKLHEVSRRKKKYPNLPNEKFLEVRKGLAAPTYKRGFYAFLFSPMTNDK